MKVGDLVKSADPYGPDKYATTEEYYPIGLVYRQHKTRFHRWWVHWVSPAFIAGEKECMLDDWLEILK